MILTLVFRFLLSHILEGYICFELDVFRYIYIYIYIYISINTHTIYIYIYIYIY